MFLPPVLPTGPTRQDTFHFSEHTRASDSPNGVEGYSLLKNSLYARFGPRSGPKHAELGAFWSFWSLISNDSQLSADFFNSAP